MGEFVEALRLEQEREEARVQLEAILRGVADAVTAQAPDGRLLFANEAAAASMGFESPEALMNASVADIMGRYDMIDEDGEPTRSRRFPAGERSRERTAPSRSSASASGRPARSAGPRSRPPRSATPTAT